MSSSDRFRIGPDRHGYDYEPLVGVEVGGFPVYRCARRRDDDDNLLHLYFDEGSSRWHAVSVAGAVVSRNDWLVFLKRPAFRAAVAHEDVRQPGDHLWESWDAERQTWWPASPFRTLAL